MSVEDMTDEEHRASYLKNNCKGCGRKGTWLNDTCMNCMGGIKARQDESMWASAVLRRVETDAEFRERLRKALGVK